MPDNPGAAVRPRCVVLGAGAQGLASALLLAVDGWDVRVVAAGRHASTTSYGAGAIWEYPPFMAGAVSAAHAAQRWTLRSHSPFVALATRTPGHTTGQPPENSSVGVPNTEGPNAHGCRVLRAYYVYRDTAVGEAAYSAASRPVGAVTALRVGLPPKGILRSDHPFTFGFSYDAPVIHTPSFLQWLERRLLELGVPIETRRLASVAEVDAFASKHSADLVVNCLGLGARQVFGDTALYPARGELVYIQATPKYGCSTEGTDPAVFAQVTDEDNPAGLTYMIPQLGGVLALGGTADPDTLGPAQGVAPATGPRSTSAIVGRCAKVFALGTSATRGDVEVVGGWTGDRPCRIGGARVELDMRRGSGANAGTQSSVTASTCRRCPIVHNYGHGGTGVVTCWGCAEDVVGLAKSAIEEDAGHAQLAAPLIQNSDLAAVISALKRPTLEQSKL